MRIAWRAQRASVCEAKNDLPNAFLPQAYEVKSSLEDAQGVFTEEGR